MTIDTPTKEPVHAGQYIVVGPHGGERLRIGASTMRLKVDESAGDGDIAFYEYVSEPGVQGPPSTSTMPTTRRST